MIKIKSKAAASAKVTAQINNPYTESYRNIAYESRAKLQIGMLLLALQTPLNQDEKAKLWTQFELMLTEYISVKYSGVLL